MISCRPGAENLQVLHVVVGLIVGAILTEVPTFGRAQSTNSGVGVGSSLQAAQPAAQQNVAPTVEHLFGDMVGIRTDLENQGITLLLDATAELAGNVSGGVKQGATFANQVGLEADVDWQRLAGIMGLYTHVIIVNRSGSSDSTLFGNNLLPIQEIYASGRCSVASRLRLRTRGTVWWQDRHRRWPHECRERFCEFATILQLHEQRAVRRSEGTAGRRHRPQRIS
jgi:carbohydrate-selective porin OprB